MPTYLSWSVNAILPEHEELRRAARRRDPEIAPRFCRTWLQLVSRTFALNIRVLPAPLEHATRLAYLFCRIADTVEDDREMPAPARIELLDRFAALFAPGGPDLAQVEAFAAALPAEWSDSDDHDQFLAAQTRLVFEEYARLDPAARRPIDACVREMCAGMAKFAGRRDPRGWFRLETVAELDEYCYFVAGTVGLLLCDLFAWHHPAIRGAVHERLRTRAVAFGLGLQVVNIAKDIAADWERSTAFLPTDLVRAQGIAPEDLLEPAARPAASRAVLELVRIAHGHLREAQAYTLDLPRSALRVRLFCLWPLLMAHDTLLALIERLDQALDPAFKVKISRSQVQRILRATTLTCWSDTLLERQFRARNARTEALLKGFAR